MVGLAVAQEIGKSVPQVIVLERHETFGQETSSRNSEVIHAGMYYPKDSLKARLCVEGNQLLYEFCRHHDIPHKKIGKLIVATKKEDMSILESLLRQGQENGVTELKMLDEKTLKKMEPHVESLSALYSSSTGILDTHRFMDILYQKAKEKGVMTAYRCDVTAIKKTRDGYHIGVRNMGEELEFHTKVFINCAGLDSDSIAQMAGFDIERLGYRLHYCRGQYFRVGYHKAALIQRLIYPAPKPKQGGLGIHVTLDLGGGLRLGPDDEYLDNREKNYEVDSSRKRDFYKSVLEFLPFIEEDDLTPDTAGIRPKLQGPNDDFRDFVIQEESQHGFAGFINLIGIESPGFTASLAIAKYVKEKVGEILS